MIVRSKKKIKSTPGSRSKDVELISNPDLPRPDTFQRKTEGDLGSRLTSNATTAIEHCYLDMNVNFNLEKDNKLHSLTVLPKVVSSFEQ